MSLIRRDYSSVLRLERSNRGKRDSQDVFKSNRANESIHIFMWAEGATVHSGVIVAAVKESIPATTDEGQR